MNAETLIVEGVQNLVLDDPEPETSNSNDGEATAIPIQAKQQKPKHKKHKTTSKQKHKGESSTSTKSMKSFKDKARELEKNIQGEFGHLVKRNLSIDDWLKIHRTIRKSKGLKSKYLIRNLTPYLFDPSKATGWTCPICLENIQSSMIDYLDHMNLIHGFEDENEVEFPCDVCGAYIRIGKYVVHWVPHFMEHKCTICNKSFALNCHMQQHYKIVHEETEQSCAYCGKLLKNELSMRRHLRLAHSNNLNWKICEICGKRVKSRCLEPHKLTHRQERPHKCDICKKCFKTTSTLHQHQKVHNNDSKTHKYLCEYCGKRFKHHTSWNLHVLRIHEGEYEHKCLICSKRFHKLFELKKHSVRHSDERPYPCPTCGKLFKTKIHLKEHMTIHSSDKRYSCPLCGKRIRMKANLYKHVKVHKNRGEIVPPLNLKDNSQSGCPISTEQEPEPLQIPVRIPTPSAQINVPDPSQANQVPYDGEPEYIYIENPQFLEVEATEDGVSGAANLELPCVVQFVEGNHAEQPQNDGQFHTLYVSEPGGQFLIPSNIGAILNAGNETFRLSLGGTPGDTTQLTIMINRHNSN